MGVVTLKDVSCMVPDQSVLNSEVSSFQRLLSIYTNVAFETDESVLLVEVSSLSSEVS